MAVQVAGTLGLRGQQRDFISIVMAFISFYLRPVIKGFLRITTRLCELQRICYGEAVGGPRTLAVERSLDLTRNREIKEALKALDFKEENGDLDQEASETEAVDEAVNVILSVKKIKRELHRQFIISLRYCIRQIWSYKKLIRCIEELRSEPYDSDNLDHERSLLELWNQLQPGVPLISRITKDWQNIGFQGSDPKTDFRGMGLLGLQNLLYFAKEYNTVAKYILSHSHHPKHGYSFAIVGINLTHMAYKLVMDGTAKPHMYNVAAKLSGSTGRVSVEYFHHFYSYLFIEFDKFWMEMKPEDVMQFNRIRDLFENRIRDELKKPEACFSIDVEVDTV